MSISASTIGWILASSASVIFVITALLTISDLNKHNKKQEEILKKINKQNIQRTLEFAE